MKIESRNPKTHEISKLIPAVADPAGHVIFSKETASKCGNIMEQNNKTIWHGAAGRKSDLLPFTYKLWGGIMAKKRKDARGIILNTGESQLTDGRYRYRYVDNEGTSHDVYSWRLRPEDKTPPGKQYGPSLREQEKQIQRDLEDNLQVWKSNMTLNALIEEYIKDQKNYWAVGTLNGYEYSFEKRIKPEFGKKKIAKLSSDDIEKFYSDIIHDEEEPLKLSSVSTLDKLVRPALQMAVRKNIIRKNPADGVIGDLKKKCPEDDSEEKHAIEETQQDKLLKFIKNDVIYSEYYPIFYMLAWTGCRINELLALTRSDIDFANEIIHVRRTLSYKKLDGRYQFILKKPKTKNGIRQIPMLADTKQILLNLIRQQGGDKVVPLRKQESPSLENLEVFIFRNSKGKLYDYSSINLKLKCSIARYNKVNEEKIPHMSCHTFRHNFCCWLCENVQGVNAADDIKYIQSIMGHADASTTLNIYLELRKAVQNSKHAALKEVAQQR